MSIATSQSLLYGTRGKVGNLVVRNVKGQSIVSTLPNPNAPKSERQKRNHSRFREAAAFANAAMRDPQLKEYFLSEAKKRKGSNPFAQAVSYKSKDLKTNPQEENQMPDASSVGVLQSQVEQPSLAESLPVACPKVFEKSLLEGLGPLEEVLLRISTAWDNLQRLQLEPLHKEVLETAARLRIQETLTRIQLSSKAKAMKFKQAMPDVEHIQRITNSGMTL